MESSIMVIDTRCQSIDVAHVLSEEGSRVLQASEGEVSVAASGARPHVKLVFCDITCRAGKVSSCGKPQENQHRNSLWWHAHVMREIELIQQAKYLGAKGWILKRSCSRRCFRFETIAGALQSRAKPRTCRSLARMTLSASSFYEPCVVNSRTNEVEDRDVRGGRDPSKVDRRKDRIRHDA